MVLSLPEHCRDMSVNTLRYTDTVGMKASVSNQDDSLDVFLGDLPTPGSGEGLADKRLNQDFISFVLLLVAGEFYLLLFGA